MKERRPWKFHCCSELAYFSGDFDQNMHESFLYTALKTMTLTTFGASISLVFPSLVACNFAKYHDKFYSGFQITRTVS